MTGVEDSPVMFPPVVEPSPNEYGFQGTNHWARSRWDFWVRERKRGRRKRLAFGWETGGGQDVGSRDLPYPPKPPVQVVDLLGSANRGFNSEWLTN